MRIWVRSARVMVPLAAVLMVGTGIGVASGAPVTAQVAPAAVPVQAPTQFYKNCAEARAAGVAPIFRGQPGYRVELDRDQDGIACETGK